MACKLKGSAAPLYAQLDLRSLKAHEMYVCVYARRPQKGDVSSTEVETPGEPAKRSSDDVRCEHFHLTRESRATDEIRERIEGGSVA